MVPDVNTKAWGLNLSRSTCQYQVGPTEDIHPQHPHKKLFQILNLQLLMWHKIRKQK